MQQLELVLELPGPPKIKPCGHCAAGYGRVFSKMRHNHPPFVTVYWVACVGPSSCGMLGPEELNEKLAIESWNNFATAPSHARALAMLAQSLPRCVDCGAIATHRSMEDGLYMCDETANKETDEELPYAIAVRELPQELADRFTEAYNKMRPQDPEDVPWD